jgi:transcriptional regulator with XRE-family HTH domain
MPESHASRGTRRGRRLLLALGDEIRASRIAAGLTLAEVAGAVAISGAELSRIERGLAPWLDVLIASRICAVVGLELSVRAYPGGDPLRDGAHARMFAAFRDLLAPGLRLRAEVPVTDDGDHRGWDGMLDDRTAFAAVELESKVADGQALARRLALKQRDGQVACLILVVLDTRWNRAALRLAGPLFESQFPLGDREIRQALSAGRVPERSGIVLLRVKRPVRRYRPT